MKDPQFTLTLAKCLSNIEVPITYDVLEYKGEKMGMFPVLGTPPLGDMTGLEHFPIFDEDYRPILVGKILDRYWNLEIGQESADMFWHALRRWLNENMPMYNELYKTIPFEQALETANLTTTTTGDTVSNTVTSGESEQLSDVESRAKTFNNEMPQTAMSEDENYATSAVESESDTTTNGSGTESGSADTTTTQEAVSTTRGYQGSQSSLLAEFRANILNVDGLILDNMRNLFMLIWRNGDTASTTEYLRGFL